ncbi:transmembrane reductase CYB561D2 isoform X1 [Ptiloglossa arizonensis]|uniref:transmembrane reductase CYB561D2 isoform X1 n=1 Tax=Ptiloglossa arizonensis TaxID=3350558 RepID=UPI003F9ECEE6
MAEISSYPLKSITVEAPSVDSLNTSTDMQPLDTKRSVYTICVITADLVNHILVIFMTVFLLYYSMRSFSVMDLHVTLCTLGYVLLMSEAIVVLAGESILTNFLTRRAKRHIHWILQVLGLVCIIGGVVVMYRVKTFHFRTIHAILGITSLVIMVFLAVCGYPVFVAAKLRKFIRPVILKFGHNFLGIACFVIGMLSQCYGYAYNWLANISAVPNVQLICITVTALITVLSLRGALLSLYRQFVILFR